MVLHMIDFESEENILRDLDTLAEQLINNFYLKVNTDYYRLVDFEFYIFTASEIFQDPYTYKHRLQLENGKLYLHGSGIDITAGDGINHCGILLRGVIKVYSDGDNGIEEFPLFTSGPQKVANTLFSCLHVLTSDKLNAIQLVTADQAKIPIENLKAIIVTTSRIGLIEKASDLQHKYLKLPLRYVGLLPTNHMGQLKIPGIENLLGEAVKEGRILQKNVRSYLGYNRNYS